MSKTLTSTPTVPFDQLYPDDANVRESMDADAIKELATSIAAVGVLQPLVIRPRDDGGYWIVSGHRRHAALAHLRRTSKIDANHPVPVHIKSDLAGADVTIAQLIENLQREDISPLDEARGYLLLTTDHKMKQSALAKMVGVSQARISKRLSLLFLPEETQAAVTAGLVNLEVAYELSKLDPKRAKALHQRVVDGRPVTMTDVQVRAAEIARKDNSKEFAALIASNMLTVLERFPEDLSMRDYAAQTLDLDGLKAYVAKRGDLLVQGSEWGGPSVRLYRPLTAAQMRARDEAATAVGEPTPSTQTADPLDAIYDAYQDACQAWRDARVQMAVDYFGGLDAKALTRLLVERLLGSPPAMFHVKHLLSALKIEPTPETAELSEYRRDYAPAYKEFISDVNVATRNKRVLLLHLLSSVDPTTLVPSGEDGLVFPPEPIEPWYDGSSETWVSDREPPEGVQVTRLLDDERDDDEGDDDERDDDEGDDDAEADEADEADTIEDQAADSTDREVGSEEAA